jgi:hypothetical protein
LLLLAALGLASSPATSQNDDSCRDVLAYSARNYSLETYDLGVALRVYDQYCENDAVRSGTKFDASLDAVIKAVPIKFGITSGSTEERTRHFCKTFSSDYQRNESQYKALSLVVNETTNAWLACKTLAVHGILFRPKIASTQIIIEVRRTSSTNASVQGIIYDPALLSCTAPNTDRRSTRSIADGDTTKRLSDEYWPVTCIRTPVESGTETVYPKVDLSISTTLGAFLLPVAAEARFPYSWASDLQKQMFGLAQRQTAVEAGLKATNARIPTSLIFGDTTMTGWHGDPSWADCPDGSVATGVILGRGKLDANAHCRTLRLKTD